MSLHRAAPFAPTTALMLREIATTYGRSPGGYLWALIEPVGAIALLSLAFSLAFRAPSLGGSFPLFYAAGYLPYMAFHDISNRVAGAIAFSRPLLGYPAVRPLHALIARGLLAALTHLSVFLIVIGGILAAFPARTSPDPAAIGAALAMTAALAAGTGTLNCCLTARFPAWARLWQIATRPLFLVSGVFFLWEDISPVWRGWLWWNPLLHITGQMRAGFYPEYAGAFVSPAYVLALAAAMTTAGLLLMRRMGDDLLA